MKDVLDLPLKLALAVHLGQLGGRFGGGLSLPPLQRFVRELPFYPRLT